MDGSLSNLKSLIENKISNLENGLTIKNKLVK